MRGYTISEILVGTFYKGNVGQGIIAQAVKRENVDADNAYSVRVTPTDWTGKATGGADFWATVFIAED